MSDERCFIVVVIISCLLASIFATLRHASFHGMPPTSTPTPCYNIVPLWTTPTHTTRTTNREYNGVFNSFACDRSRHCTDYFHTKIYFAM
jgi:hypothetical protein